MLTKQFLNYDECCHLLEIAKSINYELPAKGNGKLYYIENMADKVLDTVLARASKLMALHYYQHKLLTKYSCFLNIKSKGWIAAHKDWVELKKQVDNFNILLKKPKNGGVILHGTSQVLLNEGDAYVLDASVLHGITTVQSDDEYYSLVLWFYK
jgi:hypothetical protein